MNINKGTIEAILSDMGKDTDMREIAAAGYLSPFTSKMLSEMIYHALVNGQNCVVCPKCKRGALGTHNVTRGDGSKTIAIACNECKYVEEV